MVAQRNDMLINHYTDVGFGWDRRWIRKGMVEVAKATDYDLAASMDQSDFGYNFIHPTFGPLTERDSAIMAEWRKRWPNRPEGHKGWAQSFHTAVCSRGY